jgi:cell wall assembly regulator SMI1
VSEQTNDLSIDDLELSMRAYELLAGLGVSNVGELLTLPKIVVPADWPAKIAQLVGAEIRALFDGLGVAYAGELVLPPPQEAKLKAEGDVGARWKTIAAWLAAEQPRALAGWNPPASAAAIADAEAKLGPLPDDYKQFLAIHDGQRELEPFVGLGSLLPIGKVISTNARMVGEPEAIPEEFVDKGILAVDYAKAWLPISRSARGRDYLCIDLDPPPGGTRGQILEYVVDDSERRRVAGSFAELLSRYFELAQTGGLDFESEDADD